MAISPIGPNAPTPTQLKLQPTQPGAAGAQKPAEGSASAANSFSNLLSDAVGQIDKLQDHANANVNKLASGQPVDLHEVTLSLEQASLSFQLGLQVRNKLVEAYQEVMRMQV